MANPNFDNQFAQDPSTGEKIYGNDPRVLAVQEQWKAKGVTLNPDVIMGNLGAYGISPANPNPQPPQGGTMPPPAPMPQGGAAPASQQGAAPQQFKNPAEAFYARASEMLGKAQNYNGMKDLIDARNALVSAKNASVMQMTPEELRRFPPEVQEAMRAVQGNGIDQQIQAINGAMQARQNQQAVMKEAYNMSFALAKEFELTQGKTREDARQWMQMLMQAGVSPSQAEYEYLLDTGSVPDTMMPKLQKAIAAKQLLENQKMQQGTFQSVQADDGSLWKFNSATGEYEKATGPIGSGSDAPPDFSKFEVSPSMSGEEYIASQENKMGMSFSAAKRKQMLQDFESANMGTNPAEALYNEFGIVQLSLASVNAQKTAEAKVRNYLEKGDLKGLQTYIDGAARTTLTGAQKTDFSGMGVFRDEAIETLNALQDIKDFKPGPYKALQESVKPWLLLKKDPTYTDLIARIESAQAEYRNALFGASLTDNEKKISDRFLINDKDDIGTVEIKLKNGIKHANDIRSRLLQDARGDFAGPQLKTSIPQELRDKYPNATNEELKQMVSFSSDVGSSVNSSQLKSLTNGKTTLASLGSGTVTGIDGSSAWAPGLDFVLAGGKGAAVPSPFTGTVISSGKNGGFGNQVKIKLSSGEELWVSHLDAINVKKGQQVIAGKTILGKQGNTGTVLSGTGGKLSAAQVKSGRGTHLDLTIKKANGKLMTAREVAAALGDTRLKKT